MELKTKLEARLAKLKQDFETGNTELKKQQEQSNQLVSTLMRIQGAISVLEEQLAPEEQGQGSGTGTGTPPKPHSTIPPVPGEDLVRCKKCAVL